MATNTTVLIVVTALGAVVLASVLVGVAHKTRTQRRTIGCPPERLAYGCGYRAHR